MSGIEMNATKLPALPRRVSPDGSEIWDWAARLSAEIHRRDRIAELSRRVARHECGHCQRWMTPQCPRERHDNRVGHSVGPSMSGMPCNQYAEKPRNAALRAEWRQEMDGLANGK